MTTSVIRKVFNRLPGSIKPVHYNLRLKPDLKAFTFKGWLKVELEVVRETSQIVCNAAELKIGTIKLDSINDVGDGSTTALETKFLLCEETEKLTIEVAKPLVAGRRVSLFCAYTGILNDQMRGFYRSKYTMDGEERYCAVTQFEATDARRCFPCWDEPAIKATFSISVIAPKDRTVHSNMPVTPDCNQDMDLVTRDDVEENHSVVCFEKSPIMSTYLVAIVVGEFEACKGKTNQGVEVNAFTPRGKTEQGHFALDTSVKALEYYTDFFDVKYPLPKYDCIAISDFQCGAMENWGLVTYRESCILVDPNNTSSSSKQWIAIVVNHEMAHQWFGNLVTMEWWTHLWLNEGFASFMENNCTHALFPQFDIWTQFVADTLIAALELDALEHSHPIEVEVGHPSEVDEIFDNISYNKGASVIRMLHDYIGNDSFRKGMKTYLEKYSYRNAETHHLWTSLEQASGKPVARVMSTWTGQMGFPVIKVDKVEQDGDHTVLSISQEKFNADGGKSPEFEWNVPINVISRSDDEAAPLRYLLETKSMTLRVPNPTGEWVKLNNDFIGYYRVQYPPEILERFIPDIANKKLSELNRLSLLDDLMALVQAGTASSETALSMIKGFTGEDSYVVWRCINNCFAKLRVILADEDCFVDFNNFVKTIMSEVIDFVGWKPKAGEHHTQGLLRMMVISRMGSLGHEETVKEAKRLFENHISGVEQITADLRAPVFRVVAANGGEDVFNQMIKLYRDNELSEEKDRISRAMGGFQKPEILEKVLAFSISSDVRSQDTPYVVAAVADNHKGRDLAWDFFQRNFDLFLERYKTGALMSRLVKCSTDSFTTEERAVEVDRFFHEHKNPAERSVRQSVENIRLNAQWLKRDGKKIAEFLAKQ